MITRIWHGWTASSNAEAYEDLLRSEIFPGIRDRKIPGYHGFHLLRWNRESDVEFITLMWFESLEAVRGFAGEEYDLAVVPQKARDLLLRFDERSQHYEVKAK